MVGYESGVDIESTEAGQLTFLVMALGKRTCSCH